MLCGSFVFYLDILVFVCFRGYLRLWIPVISLNLSSVGLFSNKNMSIYRFQDVEVAI